MLLFNTTFLITNQKNEPVSLSNKKSLSKQY